MANKADINSSSVNNNFSVGVEASTKAVPTTAMNQADSYLSIPSARGVRTEDGSTKKSPHDILLELRSQIEDLSRDTARESSTADVLVPQIAGGATLVLASLKPVERRLEIRQDQGEEGWQDLEKKVSHLRNALSMQLSRIVNEYKEGREPSEELRGEVLKEIESLFKECEALGESSRGVRETQEIEKGFDRDEILKSLGYDVKNLNEEDKKELQFKLSMEREELEVEISRSTGAKNEAQENQQKIILGLTEETGETKGRFFGFLFSLYDAGNKGMLLNLARLGKASTELMNRQQDLSKVQGEADKVDIALRAFEAESSWQDCRYEEAHRLILKVMEGSQRDSVLRGDANPTVVSTARNSYEVLQKEGRLSEREDKLYSGERLGRDYIKVSVEHHQETTSVGEVDRDIDARDQVRERSAWRVEEQGQTVAEKLKVQRLSYQGKVQENLNELEYVGVRSGFGNRYDLAFTKEAKNAFDNVPEGAVPVFLKPLGSLKVSTNRRSVVILTEPSTFRVEDHQVGYYKEGKFYQTDGAEIDPNKHQHGKWLREQISRAGSFKISEYSPGRDIGLKRFNPRSNKVEYYRDQLHTIETEAGDRIEGVKLSNDALDLIRKGAPEGYTLVLKNPPESISLSTLYQETVSVGRGTRSYKYQRIQGTVPEVGADDFEYAKIGEVKLERRELEGSAKEADLLTLRNVDNKATRDVLRALENDDDVKWLRNAALSTNRTLTNLQGFINANQEGSSREAFIKFARSEADPLHEFLTSGDTKEKIRNLEEKLLEFKKLNKGTAGSEYERQVLDQINALESFIAVVKDPRTLDVVETIRDDSKFGEDSWNRWSTTELPIIAGSVAGAVAASAIVVASAGTLAPVVVPLWVTAAAGAVGGVVGAELAQEGLYRYEINYGGASRGEYTWGRRSLVGQVGNQVLNHETGKYEEITWGQVGAEYSKQAATNFVFSYASMLGSQALAGKLTQVLSKSAFVEKVMEKSTSGKLLARYLGEKTASSMTQAERLTLEKAMKQAMRQIGSEFPDEISDEFLEDMTIKLFDRTADNLKLAGVNLGQDHLAGLIVGTIKGTRVGSRSFAYDVDTKSSSAQSQGLKALLDESRKNGYLVTSLGHGSYTLYDTVQRERYHVRPEAGEDSAVYTVPEIDVALQMQRGAVPGEGTATGGAVPEDEEKEGEFVILVMPRIEEQETTPSKEEVVTHESNNIGRSSEQKDSENFTDTLSRTKVPLTTIEINGKEFKGYYSGNGRVFYLTTQSDVVKAHEERTKTHVSNKESNNTGAFYDEVLDITFAKQPEASELKNKKETIERACYLSHEMFHARKGRERDLGSLAEEVDAYKRQAAYLAKNGYTLKFDDKGYKIERLEAGKKPSLALGSEITKFVEARYQNSHALDRKTQLAAVEKAQSSEENNVWLEKMSVGQTAYYIRNSKGEIVKNQHPNRTKNHAKITRLADNELGPVYEIENLSTTNIIEIFRPGDTKDTKLTLEPRKLSETLLKTLDGGKNRFDNNCRVEFGRPQRYQDWLETLEVGASIEIGRKNIMLFDNRPDLTAISRKHARITRLQDDSNGLVFSIENLSDSVPIQITRADDTEKTKHILRPVEATKGGEKIRGGTAQFTYLDKIELGEAQLRIARKVPRTPPIGVMLSPEQSKYSLFENREIIRLVETCEDIGPQIVSVSEEGEVQRIPFGQGRIIDDEGNELFQVNRLENGASSTHIIQQRSADSHAQTAIAMMVLDRMQSPIDNWTRLKYWVFPSIKSEREIILNSNVLRQVNYIEHRSLKQLKENADRELTKKNAELTVREIFVKDLTQTELQRLSKRYGSLAISFRDSNFNSNTLLVDDVFLDKELELMVARIRDPYHGWIVEVPLLALQRKIRQGSSENVEIAYVQNIGTPTDSSEVNYEYLLSKTYRKETHSGRGEIQFLKAVNQISPDNAETKNISKIAENVFRELEGPVEILNRYIARLAKNANLTLSEKLSRAYDHTAEWERNYLARIHFNALKTNNIGDDLLPEERNLLFEAVKDLIVRQRIGALEDLYKSLTTQKFGSEDPDKLFLLADAQFSKILDIFRMDRNAQISNDELRSYYDLVTTILKIKRVDYVANAEIDNQVPSIVVTPSDRTELGRLAQEFAKSGLTLTIDVLQDLKSYLSEGDLEIRREIEKSFKLRYLNNLEIFLGDIYPTGIYKQNIAYLNTLRNSRVSNIFTGRIPAFNDAGDRIEEESYQLENIFASAITISKIQDFLLNVDIDSARYNYLVEVIEERISSLEDTLDNLKAHYQSPASSRGDLYPNTEYGQNLEEQLQRFILKLKPVVAKYREANSRQRLVLARDMSFLVREVISPRVGDINPDLLSVAGDRPSGGGEDRNSSDGLAEKARSILEIQGSLADYFRSEIELGELSKKSTLDTDGQISKQENESNNPGEYPNPKYDELRRRAYDVSPILSDMLEEQISRESTETASNMARVFENIINRFEILTGPFNFADIYPSDENSPHPSILREMVHDAEKRLNAIGIETERKTDNDGCEYLIIKPYLKPDKNSGPVKKKRKNDLAVLASRLEGTDTTLIYHPLYLFKNQGLGAFQEKSDLVEGKAFYISNKSIVDGRLSLTELHEKDHWHLVRMLAAGVPHFAETIAIGEFGFKNGYDRKWSLQELITFSLGAKRALVDRKNISEFREGISKLDQLLNSIPDNLDNAKIETYQHVEGGKLYRAIQIGNGRLVFPNAANLKRNLEVGQEISEEDLYFQQRLRELKEFKDQVAPLVSEIKEILEKEKNLKDSDLESEEKRSKQVLETPEDKRIKQVVESLQEKATNLHKLAYSTVALAVGEKWQPENSIEVNSDNEVSGTLFNVSRRDDGTTTGGNSLDIASSQDLQARIEELQKDIDSGPWTSSLVEIALHRVSPESVNRIIDFYNPSTNKDLSSFESQYFNSMAKVAELVDQANTAIVNLYAEEIKLSRERGGIIDAIASPISYWKATNQIKQSRDKRTQLEDLKAPMEALLKGDQEIIVQMRKSLASRYGQDILKNFNIWTSELVDKYRYFFGAVKGRDSIVDLVREVHGEVQYITRSDHKKDYSQEIDEGLTFSKQDTVGVESRSWNNGTLRLPHYMPIDSVNKINSSGFIYGLNIRLSKDKIVQLDKFAEKHGIAYRVVSDSHNYQHNSETVTIYSPMALENAALEELRGTIIGNDSRKVGMLVGESVITRFGDLVPGVKLRKGISRNDTLSLYRELNRIHPELAKYFIELKNSSANQEMPEFLFYGFDRVMRRVRDLQFSVLRQARQLEKEYSEIDYNNRYYDFLMELSIGETFAPPMLRLEIRREPDNENGRVYSVKAIHRSLNIVHTDYTKSTIEPGERKVIGPLDLFERRGARHAIVRNVDRPYVDLYEGSSDQFSVAERAAIPTHLRQPAYSIILANEIVRIIKVIAREYIPGVVTDGAMPISSLKDDVSTRVTINQGYKGSESFYVQRFTGPDGKDYHLVPQRKADGHAYACMTMLFYDVLYREQAGDRFPLDNGITKALQNMGNVSINQAQIFQFKNGPKTYAIKCQANLPIEEATNEEIVRLVKKYGSVVFSIRRDDGVASSIIVDNVRYSNELNCYLATIRDPYHGWMIEVLLGSVKNRLLLQGTDDHFVSYAYVTNKEQMDEGEVDWAYLANKQKLIDGFRHHASFVDEFARMRLVTPTKVELWRMIEDVLKTQEEEELELENDVLDELLTVETSFEGALIKILEKTKAWQKLRTSNLIELHKGTLAEILEKGDDELTQYEKAISTIERLVFLSKTKVLSKLAIEASSFAEGKVSISDSIALYEYFDEETSDLSIKNESGSAKLSRSEYLEVVSLVLKSRGIEFRYVSPNGSKDRAFLEILPDANFTNISGLTYFARRAGYGVAVRSYCANESDEDLRSEDEFDFSGIDKPTVIETLFIDPRQIFLPTPLHKLVTLSWRGMLKDNREELQSDHLLGSFDSNESNLEPGQVKVHFALADLVGLSHAIYELEMHREQIPRTASAKYRARVDFDIETNVQVLELYINCLKAHLGDQGAFTRAILEFRSQVRSTEVLKRRLENYIWTLEAALRKYRGSDSDQKLESAGNLADLNINPEINAELEGIEPTNDSNDEKPKAELNRGEESRLSDEIREKDPAVESISTDKSASEILNGLGENVADYARSLNRIGQLDIDQEAGGEFLELFDGCKRDVLNLINRYKTEGEFSEKAARKMRDDLIRYYHGIIIGEAKNLLKARGVSFETEDSPDGEILIIGPRKSPKDESSEKEGGKKKSDLNRFADQLYSDGDKGNKGYKVKFNPTVQLESNTSGSFEPEAVTVSAESIAYGLSLSTELHERIHALMDEYRRSGMNVVFDGSIEGPWSNGKHYSKFLSFDELLSWPEHIQAEMKDFLSLLAADRIDLSKNSLGTIVSDLGILKEITSNLNIFLNDNLFNTDKWSNNILILQDPHLCTATVKVGDVKISLGLGARANYIDRNGNFDVEQAKKHAIRKLYDYENLNNEIYKLLESNDSIGNSYKGNKKAEFFLENSTDLASLVEKVLKLPDPGRKVLEEAIAKHKHVKTPSESGKAKDRVSPVGLERGGENDGSLEQFKEVARPDTDMSDLSELEIDVLRQKGIDGLGDERKLADSLGQSINEAVVELEKLIGDGNIVFPDDVAVPIFSVDEVLPWLLEHARELMGLNEDQVDQEVKAQIVKVFREQVQKKFDELRSESGDLTGETVFENFCRLMHFCCMEYGRDENNGQLLANELFKQLSSVVSETSKILVKKFARGYFQELIQSLPVLVVSSFGSHFRFLEEFRESYLDLSYLYFNRTTSLSREASLAFLQEYGLFLQELDDKGVSIEDRNIVLGMVQQDIFSGEPNIMSCLTMLQRLQLYNQFLTLIDDGGVITDLVDGMTLDLSWKFRNSGDMIYRDILGLDPIEQLSALDALQIVVSRVSNNYWAREAYPVFYEIASGLLEHAESQLVRMDAANFLEVMHILRSGYVLSDQHLHLDRASRAKATWLGAAVSTGDSIDAPMAINADSNKAFLLNGFCRPYALVDTEAIKGERDTLARNAKIQKLIGEVEGSEIDENKCGALLDILEVEEYRRLETDEIRIRRLAATAEIKEVDALIDYCRSARELDQLGDDFRIRVKAIEETQSARNVQALEDFLQRVEILLEDSSNISHTTKDIFYSHRKSGYNNEAFEIVRRMAIEEMPKEYLLRMLRMDKSNAGPIQNALDEYEEQEDYIEEQLDEEFEGSPMHQAITEYNENANDLLIKMSPSEELARRCVLTNLRALIEVPSAEVPRPVRLRKLADDPSLCPYVVLNPSQIELFATKIVDSRIIRQIRNDFGIGLETLPLRDKLHFMRFLLNADLKTYQRFKSICESCPESANLLARAFFANAESDKYAEVLLSLAEKSSESDLSSLLERYLKIVDASHEQVHSLLGSQIAGSLEESKQTYRTALQRFLSGANRILANANARTSKDIAQYIESLSDESANVLALGAVYRDIFKGGRIDIPGVNLVEGVNAVDLSENRKEEMKELSLANWNHSYPDSKMNYPESLKVFAHEKVCDFLDHPNEKYKTYMLTYGDHILVSCVVKDITEPGDQSRVVSINSVLTTLVGHGNGFAQAFLKKVIEKEGGDRTKFVLDVYEQNKPAFKVYKNLGFEYYKIYDWTGEKLLGEEAVKDEPEWGLVGMSRATRVGNPSERTDRNSISEEGGRREAHNADMPSTTSLEHQGGLTEVPRSKIESIQDEESPSTQLDTILEVLFPPHKYNTIKLSPELISSLPALPEGYGYSGGVARNVLRIALGLEPERVRDHDIVRMKGYGNANFDADIAEEHMPEDYEHGYGVQEVQPDYFDSRDFTINEVLLVGDTLVFTDRAKNDLINKVVRPSNNQNNIFNNELSWKLAGKALRFVTKLGNGLDWSLQAEAMPSIISDFNIALQIDRVMHEVPERVETFLKLMFERDYIRERVSTREELSEFIVKLSASLREGTDFFTSPMSLQILSALRDENYGIFKEFYEKWDDADSFDGMGRRRRRRGGGGNGW